MKLLNQFTQLKITTYTLNSVTNPKSNLDSTNLTLSTNTRTPSTTLYPSCQIKLRRQWNSYRHIHPQAIRTYEIHLKW